MDEVLEPDDRAWAADKLRDAATGQVSGPHETAWRVCGGQSRRVSWTLRPLQGPNGEIQYLIVSGQDVTDQRQVEMALHSSEARYREVVENSLGFVFTCSMEGRLTSLNAFTAETLGYRAEALTGRSVSELMDASGLASISGLPAHPGNTGRVAGRIAPSPQRRCLSPHRLPQPPHGIAGRAGPSFSSTAPT